MFVFLVDYVCYIVISCITSAESDICFISCLCQCLLRSTRSGMDYAVAYLK